ncbi:permease [Canibacter sp. lx-45]|uniref:permease n=1 Tax=Canibacter zhuwentaonis TaxID=2837491 RepID=UPI001BDCBD69|nr:permease [Canibacter zhuwentaonis]MBT1035570.1 permease [Canibacter zhuwentaonis]
MSTAPASRQHTTGNSRGSECERERERECGHSHGRIRCSEQERDSKHEHSHEYASKHRRGRGYQSAIKAVCATVAIIALLRLLTTLLPAELVPWQFRDAGTLAVSVFIEAFPFVVLGTLIAVAVQFWVPQQILLKVLPRNSFMRRAVLSLLGVLMPVCECGNVPLGRGLLKRGLTSAEAITFVLAAPLLNPVTIATTYFAFGWQDGILVARIAGGFIIANLIGYVFSKHSDQKALLHPGFAEDLANSEPVGAAGSAVISGTMRAHTATPGTSASGISATLNSTTHEYDNIAHAHQHDTCASASAPKYHRAMTSFTAELTLLMPALALGSILAGLLQTASPAELLTSLGQHPLFSVLALTGLAAVVSICSTVDAFFMLSFSGTFLPGSIAAFLIFGAIIDIKMLLLLRTTFAVKTLLLITALALLATVTIGLAVNLIV